MASVRLENVNKFYEKKVHAVRDVNLQIADKEFVVLVGPSGCGKSTLLRMIAGLEAISSGTIYIDEKVVNDTPPKDRDIAMVFQNYALYPHMTVYDNMAFGLKLRKLDPAEIERRVGAAAALLGLEAFLKRKPKALSGGQRQRVAVGRAIVRQPKVFLFDEPLSNLDAKLRVQMRIEINKLHQRLQTTMIYVTHDQVEAMTMGDRIVVLKDGVIQQADTPLNIYAKPANLFVAGFIGSPAMNFIRGTLTASAGSLRFKSASFDMQLNDKWRRRLQDHSGHSVILGVRPEDLSPATAGDNTIDTQVDVIEPMGAETYTYLKTKEHTLIMRTPAAVNVTVGSTLKIKCNMEKLYFFDADTEEALN